MRIIVETLNDEIAEKSIEVISAIYIKDYLLSITFNDLSEQIIDFKPFLSKSQHPSILKYQDIHLFKTFKIIDGNLTGMNMT